MPLHARNMTDVIYEEQESLIIKCRISQIKYSNPDNYYHILECTDLINKHLHISFIGYIMNPVVDTEMVFWGKWGYHKIYGKQFEFTNYEEIIPRSKREILNYLSNGAIYGIGPVIAMRIVDAFGEDTLTVLDEEPDRLIEVHGIGEKSLARIKTGLNEYRSQRNLRFFLQEHHIPISYAPRIYAAYEKDSVEVIKTKPYEMRHTVYHFGFKTVDDIALKVGTDKNAYQRIAAGIEYALELSYKEGHCYLTRDELHYAASKVLDCEECYVVMTLDEMLKQKELILDDKAIYTRVMYETERKLARNILTILGKTKSSSEDFIPSDNREYDEKQLFAIKTAIEYPFSIITGGPGTGKSTIIHEIVRYYKKKDKVVLLAAPTGKAAKRMTETTNMEAKTIHRLLGTKSLTEFIHDEKNPLNGDVLILDECSMIDVWLMHHLMKAVPDDMKVVIVGDMDQLPSVGPGNILRDMILSKRIPTTKLTKIFRQSDNSYIAQNAHLINQGKPPVIAGKDSDFFFIKRNQNQIPETVLKLITESIPEYFHIAPSDIQVLSPMKKGACGIVSLNEQLQNLLNPNNKTYRFGFLNLRKDDRVIQLINNYEDMVFNGDTGVITAIDEHEVIIEFDGHDKPVCYTRKQTDQIMLSYALTIHKAQGSEFPVVIMPMTTSHHIMLQRNLLYTGVTRARQLVFLVGEDEAVRRCCINDEVKRRNTKLTELLA